MSIWILPAAGAPRLLAAAQLSNSVGDGAYYVCSAMYFTRVVGLSATQVGLGLTTAWAVGSLAGVPLGHLADRRGPRGTAVLLALATAAAAVAAFLAIRTFVPFVLAACLYATAQSGLAAARQALLGGLVDPAARTGLLARLQSVLNAGLAVGATLGGLALGHGTRAGYLAVFALDALGFLACALLLLRLPPVAPGRAEPAGEAKLAVLHDRPYAVVTLVNTVLLLRMPLLSLAIPLWIAARAEQLTWLVSPLFVLNTVAVMLFQVRTSRAVTDLPSATRTVRRSGAVLLAACAAFALSAAALPRWSVAAVLVAGSVLQVIGEMMQSAGSWQLSFDLAPARQLGQYQGFFGTGVAVARTLGPLLLTALLITWGTPGWLLLGALFLAAGCAMGPAARWAERTRTRPHPAVSG
ncbi:MFS transporter [Streptomyces tateyamensis]|uniref:MFS transporter n=1 Tax=Streptomyces tateyamensis TaxID=565073 RepID=A0A2V4NPJ8_9ACTN|nr:MFS transporter [Streptomyces tateyamensis]PYC88389.1 MFS transporter [Streptomyces tateyamensis]